MTNPIRAALSQPEPAGQIPPDYIDPQHTGADRELLQAFYAACQSEGGTVDEVTLRGIRAAIAADRAQRQPVPPEPGEVQELVELIRQIALAWEPDATLLGNMTAGQLARAADLLESLSPPQPVPMSERLPGPEQPTRRHLMMLAADMGMASVDDAAEYARAVLARWGRPAPQPPADGEVQELVKWLRELGAKRGGVFDVSTFCANLARAAELLAQRHPQPVPMRERPWEREGWCDEQGRCWLCGKVEGDWRFLSPTNSGLPHLKYGFTHCLPAHALPLPGEVEHG